MEDLWLSMKDSLSFDSDKPLNYKHMEELRFTKRGIIRITGRIDYRLGLVSTFGVSVKILLQAI